MYMYLHMCDAMCLCMSVTFFDNWERDFVLARSWNHETAASFLRGT